MASRAGMAKWAAGILICAGVSLLAACQATTTSPCGEVLKGKCQTCHSLTRVCTGLGRDKKSWQRSIAKMAHYSSVITGSDEKTLVKCLANQEKDVTALCGQ